MPLKFVNFATQEPFFSRNTHRRNPGSLMRLVVLTVLVLGSAAADSVYFTNPRLVRPIGRSSAPSIFNLRGGDSSFEIHDVAESDEEEAGGTAKPVLCLAAPWWLKMQAECLQDIPVEWKLRLTAPLNA